MMHGLNQGTPAEDIIRVKDQYYILATSSLADDRTRVLKQGETFAIFDRHGDIRPVGLGVQGIYHEGTRYLSRLEFRIGSDRPMLLSSTVTDDNSSLTVDLTNPDTYTDGVVSICRGTVHISRSMFLWKGHCYERLRIWNYGLVPIDFSFSLFFDADFADIFEVRGVKRKERGRCLETAVHGGAIVLAYEGLDGVLRRTRLDCSPPPREVLESVARFETRLEPKGEASLFLTVGCETSAHAVPLLSYQHACAEAAHALEAVQSQDCDLFTSNEQFNDWLNRSLADLHMMVTGTPHGPYPYAGVPWFSTPFGRDGLITAMEVLWVKPEIARGVLTYLAATQAKEVIPEQDAEPGKILHEARSGEMAALGEIPFGRYYGSVDAPSLFVMLAGEYHRQTGDTAFLDSIWPNIELVLRWLETYGDPDGDGFVEYARHSPQGLVHQGWKDSKDAVFHADGSPADSPIALCEVQAYAYAARRGAAEIALALGKGERARALLKSAEELRERFERAFWSEELGTYVLALDGKKRPCRVRSSNAGYCLLTGIADPARARRVMQTLLGEDSFSGWGIRTVAASEIQYNPMSYHNGSVWPHDNAVIAAGMARYGFKDAVVRILTGLFDASLVSDLHRLPELFCGFIRRPNVGPTLYPVACAPQSWAAASVFLLLQASLGLSIIGADSRIRLANPVLPEFLERLRVRNLRVGKASVDLLFERHPPDVGVRVLRMDGQVIIEKSAAASPL